MDLKSSSKLNITQMLRNVYIVLTKKTSILYRNKNISSNHMHMCDVHASSSFLHIYIYIYCFSSLHFYLVRILVYMELCNYVNIVNECILLKKK